MISDLANQPSLFEQNDDSLSSKSLDDNPSLRISLVMDHREWLFLLANDWLEPSDQRAYFILGIDSPRSYPPIPERIQVIAWLDIDSFPSTVVQIRSRAGWRDCALCEVTNGDMEIAWRGPVPLFCIEKFSVSSEYEKLRLVGMARGFSNLAIDFPDISVASIEISPAGSDLPSASLSSTFKLPRYWNELRGAAAMSAWAVPAIEPWIAVLANSFSFSPDEKIAAEIDASWWTAPPWHMHYTDDIAQGSLSFWESIIYTLLNSDVRRGWNPLQAFNNILALIDPQSVSDNFGRFIEETEAILSDRAIVDIERGLYDPLGLALQLVLLRPSSERFVTWSADLPGIIPSVWWTGACLSGLITGFRDLESRFAGMAEGRKFFALRTWGISTREKSPRWTEAHSGTEVKWTIARDLVTLEADGIVFAERKESSRNRWYSANLNSPQVRGDAIKLAQRLNPKLLRRILKLVNVELPFIGEGLNDLELSNSKIIVTGRVDIEIPAGANIDTDLLDLDFLSWIVKGSINERLPFPEFDQVLVNDVQFVTAQNFAADLIKSEAANIRGLWEVPHFLSPDQEKEILAIIDNSSWNTVLSRRVQHYGWLYDYKKGKIDFSKKIGPLPPWAEMIAQDLFDANLVPEIPDQLIVNEYEGNQGIAPHIDCPSCFVGPIVTISLIESWVMLFHHPSGNTVPRTLARGSAFILDGDSRSVWKHEIPKKINESWGRRGRRVSLTFRKVNVNQNNSSKRSKR